jgi:hypothetical protein
MSYYIGILKKTYNDEEDLRILELNKYKVKEIYMKLKTLSNIRFYLLLGLIRNFGDLLISCYELKLFENFLGTRPMGIICSISGFLSGGIGLYQMFNTNPYYK